MKTKLIERKEYLEKLDAWRDKQAIKIVTGVRRCGKSSLLALFIEKLKVGGVLEKNIVNINLEDMKNRNLLSVDALYDHIEKHLGENGTTYVFIDEVQLCRGFEKAVVSLNLKKNVDIYITGSNATLLSGDLATLMAGRYIEIEMLPLSFREYVEFVFEGHQNFVGLFEDYMEFGSFPYIPELLKEDSRINDFLSMIYDTIILRDIVTRTQTKDVTLLEDIVRFLCSSIGSPVSTKKISDTINSAGRKISQNTVEQYVRALTDSFIFYKVDRFDIRGKQHLKTQNKYYIVDSGIRNMLMSSSSPDTGHMIENIVFLELLRRAKNRKVKIGKIDDKEIDFVVSNTAGGLSYYQIALTVADENTLLRELEPLNKVKDHFPKYLLTLDRVIGNNAFYNGIRHVNIVDWLLNGEDYVMD